MPVTIVTSSRVSGVSVQYLAFVSSSSAAQYDHPLEFRPERWLRGHECHHQVTCSDILPARYKVIAMFVSLVVCAKLV